jgi:sec-independent protein translocase protein TatA
MASANLLLEFQIAMIPGGIGYLELLLLFAVILVLFGPSRLPVIARQLGRLFDQLRRGAMLFQHNLMALEDEVSETPGSSDDPDPVEPRGGSEKEGGDGSAR